MCGALQMSTLAIESFGGPLLRIGSPPAGDAGRRLFDKTAQATCELKMGISARSSWIFNDLHALAEENGIEFLKSDLFVIAQRFLLSVPEILKSPELSLDSDGEIRFDWHNSEFRMLSVALRRDGRLTYAARTSICDTDYGTKFFTDEIPQIIVLLVRQVCKS